MGRDRATLTEQQKEKLAEEAHANEQAIIETKSRIGAAFWQLGELLVNNKDKNLWAVQNSTWTAFIGSPEIGIEEATSRRLVRLIIVRRSLEAQGHKVDWSGISETRLTRDWLPCVEVETKNRVVLNPKEAIELLEAARTLSLGDYKKLVAEHKKKDVGTVEPLVKEDTPVFINGQVGGFLRNVRATSSSHYLTIRVENEHFAKFPVMLELRG